MEQRIRTIVEPLVEEVDHIQVDCEESDQKVVYKLSVHPDEMGKIIGKGGRVANAIRTLLYATARDYHDQKVYLDIVDS